ncbi:MAG TPA: hypothetical protein VK850_08635 [Candidatus Binatia bacterium]|nr:hypothetical protein [Candidatus Binatia bacterium]
MGMACVCRRWRGAERHGFLRTMDTYQTSLSNDTTLILSTDSELFRYLKNSSHGK